LRKPCKRNPKYDIFKEKLKHSVPIKRKQQRERERGKTECCVALRRGRLCPVVTRCCEHRTLHCEKRKTLFPLILFGSESESEDER